MALIKKLARVDRLIQKEGSEEVEAPSLQIEAHGHARALFIRASCIDKGCAVRIEAEVR